MTSNNNEYITKGSIYDVMDKDDRWDHKLLRMISQIPGEDVIPVEWIEKWMNERCGYKHTVCKNLLNDWDKEKNQK